MAGGSVTEETPKGAAWESVSQATQNARRQRENTTMSRSSAGLNIPNLDSRREDSKKGRLRLQGWHFSKYFKLQGRREERTEFPTPSFGSSASTEGAVSVFPEKLSSMLTEVVRKERGLFRTVCHPANLKRS